jgi:hypothetical protein
VPLRVYGQHLTTGVNVVCFLLRMGAPACRMCGASIVHGPCGNAAAYTIGVGHRWVSCHAAGLNLPQLEADLGLQMRGASCLVQTIPSRWMRSRSSHGCGSMW